MRLAHLALLAVPLVVVAQVGLAPGAGVDAPTVSPADEQVLKSANLPATGPAALEFFRRRTPADVPEKTLTDLTAQLGDKDAEAANRAFGELVGFGPAAVAVLRRAANDVDRPELAERARQCLARIEGPESAKLAAAASRVLVVFKPVGAADALLGYLPHADNDALVEEIVQALTTVAMREGKPEPALLKALEDPAATRRAAAARVLCQAGAVEHRPAVRRLLQDPKPAVRLQAGLALARANDGEAIPVLIALLAELAPEQAKPVEEYLTQLAGEWTLNVPAGADSLSRRLRRDLWTAWWRSTDGPVLVEEFRKRTPSDAERDKIQGLIRQLEDYNPEAREKALAELIALGNVAVPLLRQAVNDPSGKGRERVQKCLQLVDRGEVPPLPTVAVRLMALRKPDGATEALLAYLAAAEDDSLATEAQTALGVLAYRDGKPDPVLVRGLQDKVWQRRAGAAEALCQAGLDERDEQRQALRKLLEDPEPRVRLRVALALASARDRQAIPVLIALLGELPPEQLGEVEAVLRLLAEEQAPTLSLGTDEESRRKCRDAWATWWRDLGHKADLAKLQRAERLLGYTLVVEQYSQLRRSGRVAELDAGGKVRWEITGLQNPFDAVVGPGDRVLIAEQGVNRVTERDLKGNVLWQKPLNVPLSVQRLPNGNAFLVGRGQMVEVDRAGKELFNHNRPNQDIMAGARLRDGHIVFLNYNWEYTRLDAQGKTVKSFRLGPLPFGSNTIDFLPNDRILVPDANTNRVVEFDPDGKRVWDIPINQPSALVRLPNGNTLVACAAGMRIVELNQAGKVVWEHKENFNPWRARRR